MRTTTGKQSFVMQHIDALRLLLTQTGEFGAADVSDALGLAKNGASGPNNPRTAVSHLLQSLAKHRIIRSTTPDKKKHIVYMVERPAAIDRLITAFARGDKRVDYRKAARGTKPMKPRAAGPLVETAPKSQRLVPSAERPSRPSDGIKPLAEQLREIGAQLQRICRFFGI